MRHVKEHIHIICIRLFVVSSRVRERARKYLYSTGVNNSVLLNPMTLSAASHFVDDLWKSHLIEEDSLLSGKKGIT